MKSPRRIVPKPQFKLQNILQRLLKEPILYTEFLELLTQATDSLYETGVPSDISRPPPTGLAMKVTFWINESGIPITPGIRHPLGA